MGVSTPIEPVYYYERSSGKTRLVYFVPPETMQRLHEQGLMNNQALLDMPDGADIDCCEPRFEEFERYYGYRPKFSPEALHRAFYSILTTTRRWQRFRGAGFIQADVLENQALRVEDELRSRNLVGEEDQPSPEHDSAVQRRRLEKSERTRQTKIEKTLRDLPAEKINPRMTLDKQMISKIAMGPGKRAEEAFAVLLR